MGPLNLEQFREKLIAQHPERKLVVLGQLWEAFRLRSAFLESVGTNSFAATVVSDLGVGNLKEVNGMVTLQVTPFQQVTGSGVRERPENAQFFLMVGDRELHLVWPGGLAAMMEDETFAWLVRRLAECSSAPAEMRGLARAA